MARPTWTQLRCTAPRQTSGKWWLPWRRVELGPVSSHVPWRHSTVTATTVYPSHWDHYRLCVCVCDCTCVGCLYVTCHYSSCDNESLLYRISISFSWFNSPIITLDHYSSKLLSWALNLHTLYLNYMLICFITTFPDNLFLFLHLMDSCMRHTPPLHCNPDPLHFQHWLLV